MTLRAFIIEYDPKRLAKELAVDPSTVSFWRTGNALPRPPMLVRLHKLSRGRVTYEEMITTFVRKHSNTSTK